MYFKGLRYIGFLVAFKALNLLKTDSQFLAAESPLKLMKNAFYFTLQAVFVLKIFT